MEQKWGNIRDVSVLLMILHAGKVKMLFKYLLRIVKNKLEE